MQICDLIEGVVFLIKSIVDIMIFSLKGKLVKTDELSGSLLSESLLLVSESVSMRLVCLL